MAVLMLKVSVVFLLLGCVSSSLKRKVVTKARPDCDKYPSCSHADPGDIPNIVYTKASTAQNDNLHYVFSTKELPTIIVARTTRADTNMLFDWDKIMSKNSSLSDAINFSNEKKIMVDYKYGICFTMLIEYNDVDDDANLVDVKGNTKVEWKNRFFNNITWMPLEMVSEMDNSFNFNTSDDGLPLKDSNNGSLIFSFHIPSSAGRVSALPSQKYSANETLFVFELDNFTPSFKNSRFAIETLAASLGTSKKMSIETIRTIDDEYSPGVFQLTNWFSNPSDTSKSGFMQWKPVCYIKQKRGRKTSAIVKHYDFENVEGSMEEEILNATLLFALFGDDLYNGKSDVKIMNISFGQPKDGYYVKNNYTVWTAAVGYGTPPKDEISLTVIIIISAGLGIPVLIIIFGGIFTIVRKARGKRSEYQPINDNGAVNRNSPQ